MSAPGASSSIASIVGTSTVWVIRSRSIASSTAAASKRGRSTCSAPTHVHASRFAIPATWNIGHTCSQRWSGRWPVAARLCCALASRLPWLSITPFGRPGRAAGVGDGGERVGVEVARRDGRAGEQVLPRDALAAEVDVLVGDQEGELGVLDDEPQLLGREAVVQADHHPARRRHAQPRLGVRARVDPEEADPRARGEIEARQAVGQLAVGDRERGAVAVQRLRPPQRPAEVAHSPSRRAAFSFSTSGRTSSRISSFSKSASQRSGVISG